MTHIYECQLCNTYITVSKDRDDCDYDRGRGWLIISTLGHYTKSLCRHCLEKIKDRLKVNENDLYKRIKELEIMISANNIGVQNVYNEFKKADAGQVLDKVKLIEDHFRSIDDFIKKANQRLNKLECYEQDNEWIGVYVTKPPLNQDVLIKTDKGKVHIHSFAHVHRVYSMVYTSVGDKPTLITHWMELPK